MGNKIVTEADRKYTPPLKALPGVTLPTTGRGQRVSLEQQKEPRQACQKRRLMLLDH
jgi:hypothetical protein